MTYLTDFTDENDAFDKTRREFPAELPIESANEWQNALTHIAGAFLLPSSEHNDAVTKSTAHMRRAHLDYLKVYVFDIYRQLCGIKSTAIGECMSAIAHARILEFGSVGGKHKGTVNTPPAEAGGIV
ncbi:MAG: hypothetical protein LBC14_01075 [Desulfovibrio sp.]|jgi:hypothetical protein|nr:hypothetical protein [Desulfovibrio sp.]